MLFLFALLGVFGLSAGLGASAFDYQELNHHANLVVDSQKLQPKLATYDDTNYVITFDLDDLYIGGESRQFVNLSNAVFNVLPYTSFSDGTFIIYNNQTFAFDDFSQEDLISYAYSGDGDYFYINFYSSVNNDDDIFRYVENESFFNFYYGFEWHLNSTLYATVKSAVQADLNTAFDGGAVATDIVTTLVGGITGIATGLGAGVSALVSDIFISNGTLSVFGYIVVIFAGIALAIGLSRWVMNFLTSLGAKK